ncbi:hypothetical protein [Streptomyces sp. NPDC051572]|uniref:hypothetical protein n=1 Tax=Streptomyces sp. NPDC051572 TaxID=3155802 RepID=UPI00344BD934
MPERDIQHSIKGVFVVFAAMTVPSRSSSTSGPCSAWAPRRRDGNHDARSRDANEPVTSIGQPCGPLHPQPGHGYQ